MPNTLTSSQVAKVLAGTDFPMAFPSRVNAINVKFTQSGTSLSTGDVIQFVAVPDHARILDVMVSRDSGVVDSMILSVGDASNTSRWISSGSMSATTGVYMLRAQNGQGLNYLISLSSSNEAVAVETIDLTVVSLSPCVTGSYQMTVFYMYEPGESG
ncbi:hypothetical protein UFOVP1244_30 [uncultured Caudovirales phage]|uniref:Uncharacterized protein n=1 Tax=uncultured Caudovirales phage TaxID=2100421 RepID=A0A6J5RFQ7_9CAUD|nr:hypothetical protein UFOVP1244_30 [uncultured Caudovirales phage]